MTVSYQYDVASSASGGFIRLLFRWRGSVWKVVYREMLIFTVCYILLTILYQFVLADSQQRIFERIVYFCSTFMDLIPLSFMLGFYVSFIAARWWSQYTAIPWPDKLMNIVAMYIPGLDESSRVVRRTLMRYLNLSLVLVLRSISMAVKRRFPTKEHLIEAGFMTKTELEMFQSVPSTEFNTFWIPCTWFINVLREARQECRITDSNGLKLIMEELNEFRSKCGLLWGYDWISIPLVYTQVVTMATYAFFVACMFGRQNVNVITEKSSSPEVHRYDYYIPIFTILQLMFYMGLLKVAEQLINPFGDDDEDFELNWIIDRHMKVSYLGVDTLNGTPPPLVKDTYYNELDVKIPYTEASKGYKKKTYRGSVAYMQVPMEQQGMVLPDMSEEEDDGETVSENMGPRRPSVYTLFHSRGSNHKGVSPASSFTNLDNRSIASLDSEWKCSLPNLSTSATQNASGTLGYDQASPCVIDMATAEDNEMVLQEVKVEQTETRRPTVERSFSLQIPETSKSYSEVKEPTTSFNIRRGLSPKIAPKFPREKLKSMFRKRRLSSAFPFYKLKGVRFSRDTKDDDESVNQSLLDVSYQEPEVEITLSTPELTETEKETGVHPYYYTQQITSAKQLATGKAFLVRQTDLPRYGSEEEKMSKGHQLGSQMSRASSLPIIQQSDTPSARDPIIALSLKKISDVMKTKQKVKKKKSPPPQFTSKDTISTDESQEDEPASDTESLSRRNTLPQITVTRYGQKASEHLDLATSANSSGHSSGCSSDSGKLESSNKRVSVPPGKEKSSEASSPTYVRKGSVSPEKTFSSISPETHSTSKSTKKASPQQARIAETAKIPTDDTKRKSHPRRKSPPPPKRPETLVFAKSSFTPSKKIAGISLKSSKPSSPTSESIPSSPISTIPHTPSKVGRSSSFPKPVSSTCSPKRSPTTEFNPFSTISSAQTDTSITISDSREDIREMSDEKGSQPISPPEPPQRRIPRANIKGKK